MTVITVSAFRWVVPSAQGLVRDLRVRWALEEAGLTYEERLPTLGDQMSQNYRQLQPRAGPHLKGGASNSCGDSKVTAQGQGAGASDRWQVP
jgi:hypothetical protein